MDGGEDSLLGEGDVTLREEVGVINRRPKVPCDPQSKSSALLTQPSDLSQLISSWEAGKRITLVELVFLLEKESRS